MSRIYLIAGAVCILSGSILMGLVYVALSNYVPHMTGWSDPPGRFSSALDGVMARAPFVISIILMILGLIFIAISLINEITRHVKIMNNNKEIKAGEESKL